jgi:hypothetical protein
MAALRSLFRDGSDLDASDISDIAALVLFAAFIISAAAVLTFLIF